MAVEYALRSRRWIQEEDRPSHGASHLSFGAAIDRVREVVFLSLSRSPVKPLPAYQAAKGILDKLAAQALSNLNWRNELAWIPSDRCRARPAGR